MKSFKVTAFTTLTIFVLYVVGYWAFIKKDLIYYLKFDNDDPFQPSTAQSVVRGIFGAAEEVDLRLSFDAPLRRYLVGQWKSDGSGDFVSITSSHQCAFHVGRFDYVGAVAYDRAYVGFFTEFRHEGKRYIFIFSPVDWVEDPSPYAAHAFIGHDLEPDVRDSDHLAKMTKKVE